MGGNGMIGIINCKLVKNYLIHRATKKELLDIIHTITIALERCSREDKTSPFKFDVDLEELSQDIEESLTKYKEEISK